MFQHNRNGLWELLVEQRERQREERDIEWNAERLKVKLSNKCASFLRVDSWPGSLDQVSGSRRQVAASR